MRIERKDNESLSGVLIRARRLARVNDCVFVMYNGRCESAFDRIRKTSDGDIWKRRGDEFRFDTEPQTPIIPLGRGLGGWGR